MEKTLQTQYNLIKEGKGNKAQFFKSAVRLFPDLITPVNTFEDTVRILKNRGIISEGIGGVVTTGKKQDWHAIFNENMTNLKEEKEAKAEEKETTKEVTDMATRGYDYKDAKNYDNVFGEEFLKGFYTEMGDSKNEGKTVEELRAIVAKNLAKDMSHYVKDGQFGLKGVGYQTEAPGLGTPKEPKGKYKSSGYGDLKESVLRSQIHLLVKEVLAEMNRPERPKVKPETTSKQPADLTRSEYSHVKLKAPKVKQELNKEALTPEDEEEFTRAIEDAEQLYEKTGSVEGAMKSLPKEYNRFEKEIEQHLIQKYEG